MDLAPVLEKFGLHIPVWDLFIRIILSTFLGAILGLERERAFKPAGMRTHMLVSLGSATFVILNLEIMEVYRLNITNIDPGRVIQGIVTGIGFLGAGSIIQSDKSIRGLTTAATIWLTGAIGATCGFGLYGLAIFITFVGLGVLTLVRFMRHFSILSVRKRGPPPGPPPESSDS